MSYASRVRGTASPKKPAPAGKFVAGLLGLQVTVELISGRSYQGVLLQKSTAEAYCLGQVQLVSKDQPVANASRFENEMSFDISEVACLRIHSEAKGDRDEFSSSFKTDAEIGVRKADKAMRSLKKWDGGDDDGTSISLDQEAKMRPEDRGWDQFSVNEKLFGYQSSYAEDNYTTTLDRQSDFYRQNEPTARKVAAEIENEVSDNPHLAEERGHDNGQDLDEESRYSTVLDRPESAPNVYRPPALRGKSPEKGRATRSQASSSPPVSSQQGSSPPKSSASSVKDAQQPASSANSSPAQGHLPAQDAPRSQSPRKAESVNGNQSKANPSESGTEQEKTFQFNAGAKEFVPSMPVPGIYFADGSYMPVVDSSTMPQMQVYPTYSFNPYVSPYAPMGYVHQPMTYAAPSGYPAYQGQQGQHPNRSRPHSRASRPNQPNAPEPNGNI